MASSDTGPWVSLNTDELLRILNQHKIEGEHRRITFKEKIDNMKERQEMLQQRRVARLRTEGIVMDLEAIKRRCKVPRGSLWHVDEDEEKGQDLIRQKLQEMVIKRKKNTNNDTKVSDESGADEDTGDDELCFEEDSSKRITVQRRNYTDWCTAGQTSNADIENDNEIGTGKGNRKGINKKQSKTKSSKAQTQHTLKKARVKCNAIRHLHITKPENAQPISNDKEQEVMAGKEIEKPQETTKLEGKGFEKVQRAGTTMLVVNAFKGNKTTFTPRSWKTSGQKSVQQTTSRRDSFYDSNPSTPLPLTSNSLTADPATESGTRIQSRCKIKQYKS